MTMAIKIFHTGDIHIGSGFTSYPQQIREGLREARHEVLENMVKKANDLKADLFVIAGDLFNTIQVSKKDINRTVKALNGFAGHCSLILPGNHDYDNGAIDLWKNFQKTAAPHVLLLNEERVYDLTDQGLDVKIFPAPCHSKHSSENALGWIKDEAIEGRDKRSEAAANEAGRKTAYIGIGHGAIEGLSPDLAGSYYYMSMKELNEIPVDLWLLGHTHVAWPENEKVHDHRIFNNGSPEPDGLDFRGEGTAWLIELEKDKIVGEKIPVGKYRFYDLTVKMESIRDLDKAKDQVLDGDEKRKLVRLNLVGQIPKEDYEKLGPIYKELEEKLFYSIIRDENLKIKIDTEVIKSEFTEGSFPYEFLASLVGDEEALQMAYELLKEES